VRTIENFADGVVSDADDKTVGYTFNGAGMTSLTAYLTGGGGQTTQYLYGVTLAGGSAVESNDAVGATRWPDPTTGAASSGQQELTTVNALGQVVTMTDRNGSVHTLSYDMLGRVVFDSVTTLGSDVDGAVRLIETRYDEQGNAYRVTSYDGPTGGNIVNDVLRQFNGLGQLTVEYQSHQYAVNTATTPKVQYAWSEMPSGANHSRLTSVTYPDGYVLTHNYSSGLNSGISRLSSLSDTTGTLEEYEYLGLAGVVVRSHPQPDLDLTYAKRSGESNGDAGDQYTGLDRFGRVVDQRWLDASSGVATDRFQYGYDLLGNRLFRDNLVNAAFGELYGYDAMTQLVSFDRGTLNGPKTGLTGAASRAQDWDYDAVGNFDSVTTNGTAQTRTANAQNEITGIGGLTTPTYDANGNMTGDETGKQFVFDAWNRLVTVKNSGGATLKTYSYDGQNRRVTETAGGTTTDLFYSANWQVLAEKVGSNFTRRYVWSPVYVDAMVLRDRDTDANGTLDERLWVQQDANWNVTALVNGSGAVVERYVYDAFGVRSVYDASWSSLGSSAYSWSSGFQGTFFDSIASLNAVRERWYSPTLGRPVQLDPLGFAEDVNFYRWERNNPVRYTDPLGLGVRLVGADGKVIEPSAEERAQMQAEFEALMMDIYPDWMPPPVRGQSFLEYYGLTGFTYPSPIAVTDGYGAIYASPSRPNSYFNPLKFGYTLIAAPDLAFTAGGALGGMSSSGQLPAGYTHSGTSCPLPFEAFLPGANRFGSAVTLGPRIELQGTAYGVQSSKIGVQFGVEYATSKRLIDLGRQASKESGAKARRLLTELAEEAGFTVQSGGNHLTVADAAGRVITQIPHTPKGQGTIKAIVNAILDAAP